LAELLKEKGYPIARRTIAKYREQLDIPCNAEEDIRLLTLYFD
jgi:DNA-directed RNA polymerase specialized sigma54-like protein